ncbi:MAG: hypothetical protein Q7T03_06190 [Deltaproteobacteria bacterium]|nr:hypothetical protein [Deltaproteobacteria bacterium]
MVNVASPILFPAFFTTTAEIISPSVAVCEGGSSYSLAPVDTLSRLIHPMASAGAVVSDISFIPTPRQIPALRALANKPFGFREKLSILLVRLEGRHFQLPKKISYTDFEQKLLHCLGDAQYFAGLKAEYNDMVLFAQRAVEERIPPAAVFKADEVCAAFETGMAGISVPVGKYPRASRVAEYLRFLEAACHIDPLMVARKSGVPLENYRRYRRGNMAMPKNHMRQLARVFGIDEKSFLLFVHEFRRRPPASGIENEERISEEGKPHARELALFLRKLIGAHFGGYIAELERACGVSVPSLRQLLRGEIFVFGQGTTHGVDPLVSVYCDLLHFLSAFSPKLAHEFIYLVCMAYLETCRWEGRYEWFQERMAERPAGKERLIEFFRDFRRQILLNASGIAFRSLESLSPKERIVFRVIHWWVSQNYGFLTHAFLRGLDSGRLFGLGREAFISTVRGHPLFKSREWVEQVVSHLQCSEIFDDWVAWRKEELQKKYETRRTTDAAKAIYYRTLEKWVPLNGGGDSYGFNAISAKHFGVGRNVLFEIAKGRPPRRYFYIRKLAMAVEDLSETDVDAQSEIIKHWRVIHG